MLVKSKEDKKYNDKNQSLSKNFRKSFLTQRNVIDEKLTFFAVISWYCGHKGFFLKLWLVKSLLSCMWLVDTVALRISS